MKVREMGFVVSDEVNEETEVTKKTSGIMNSFLLTRSGNMIPPVGKHGIVDSVQDASGPIGRNEKKRGESPAFYLTLWIVTGASLPSSALTKIGGIHFTTSSRDASSFRCPVQNEW